MSKEIVVLCRWETRKLASNTFVEKGRILNKHRS